MIFLPRALFWGTVFLPGGDFYPNPPNDNITNLFSPNVVIVKKKKAKIGPREKKRLSPAEISRTHFTLFRPKKAFLYFAAYFVGKKIQF